MMDLFAPRHLLIILVIALVVFGGKKLKTLGSDLGSAVRGFKQAMKDGEADTESAPPPTATRTSQPELAAPAQHETAASSPSSTTKTSDAKAA